MHLKSSWSDKIMLYAFCGEDNGYNMGNLKSCTMTLFAILDYLNGMKIYSNYGLEIPHTKIHSIRALMTEIDELNNVVLAFDELGVWFDAYSRPSDKDGTKVLKNFARQTRKRNIQMYYTAQTFFDINKSLRKITHKIYLIKKFHGDFTECIDDECYEQHLAQITPVRMYNNVLCALREPIYIRIPPIIFDLYNTNELINITE